MNLMFRWYTMVALTETGCIGDSSITLGESIRRDEEGSTL